MKMEAKVTLIEMDVEGKKLTCSWTKNCSWDLKPQCAVKLDTVAECIWELFTNKNNYPVNEVTVRFTDLGPVTVLKADVDSQTEVLLSMARQLVVK